MLQLCSCESAAKHSAAKHRLGSGHRIWQRKDQSYKLPCCLLQLMTDNVTAFSDKPLVAAAGKLVPVRKILVGKAMCRRQALGNRQSVNGNRGLKIGNSQSNTGNGMNKVEQARVQAACTCTPLPPAVTDLLGSCGSQAPLQRVYKSPAPTSPVICSSVCTYSWLRL